MSARAARRSLDQRAITVAGALRFRPLADGVPEILAGAAGLENPVRWVHSVEAPRVATLLHGGELLLMTGLGLPDDEAGQRRFIASLAERGVAGVVIELGSALTRMPRGLVSEAEARNLPLIALHREVPFVEVTEVLHRELVNQQTIALERGEEAHRRFTELVLEGAGVAEVLQALAELIGNPVVLEKADEGVVYHETYQVPEAALHAAWEAAMRGLPEAPACESVPVFIGRRHQWGTLHALALSGPLTSLDRVVIERGASVIALAMLRRHQEQELAVRERGRLISVLMSADGAVDEHEAAALAADLGFDRRYVLRLPLVALRAVGGTSAETEVAPGGWGAVWREVAGELATRRVAAVAGVLPHTQGLGVIVAIASARERAQVAEQVSRAIRDAVQRKLAHVPLTIAVGDVGHSWAAVGAGLRDALGAGQAAVHGPPRAWHDATLPDLGRLLFALRDHPEVRTFVQRSLEGILDHDRGHHSQFLTTIEAYCEHGGRMAETARSLHLQRQSLYKRLARIEGLLGGELADPDLRLGLHLALVARRYISRDDVNGSR